MFEKKKWLNWQINGSILPSIPLELKKAMIYLKLDPQMLFKGTKALWKWFLQEIFILYL